MTNVARFEDTTQDLLSLLMDALEKGTEVGTSIVVERDLEDNCLAVLLANGEVFEVTVEKL